MSCEMPVSRDVTWRTISDPATYPDWLVGAVEIRSIDEDWPAPGSAFRHRVGLGGPFTTADSTSVVAVDEPTMLVLEARARPFGRAHVEIEVRDLGDRSEVVMREGLLDPLRLLTPLAQPLVRARNQRSLHQLQTLLADGDHDRSSPGEGA